MWSWSMIENLGYDSSKGLTLVMEKHGTHDQKTHGNWAKGSTMGEGVATSILERVKANGGLSVKMTDGSEPTTGYMVAKGTQYGAVVDAADFYDPEKGPKALADYMKKNKSDLGSGKNYLGLWHNTEDGKVYLDVSENIQDKERAISAGAKRDQISIWDVANFAEIQTGGTGNVQKIRSGGIATEYLTDERRRDRGLRTENLGEVRQASKVIRFAPGLKPVLKHLPGQHDQSTHGAWANAGYTLPQEMQIAAMEGRGPTLDDLNNMSGGFQQADYGDLVDLVNNDSDLYDQAIDGISERVAEAMKDAGIAPTDEQRKASIYDQIQTEMIDEFIASDDGSLAQMWQEQNNQNVDAEYMHSKLDEVYSFEHTGTNAQGEEISLRSQIEYIDSIEEDGIRFRGNVVTSDGDYAGEFERTFYKNDDGGWSVEHDLFRMEDEFAGTGFGTEFIKQQEAYYIAQGFDSISVGTAWDGARHWARAGYDWNPGREQMNQNFSQLMMSVNSRDGFEIGSQNRKEFDTLMDKMVVGYVPGKTGSISDIVKFKDMKGDGFPLPADFANIGIDRKTKTGNFVDWAGKELTAGLHMKYEKRLTAEGTTLLSGPIDRDGDGLVYDGTPREKPAPSN